jgi:hypothetical protein
MGSGARCCRGVWVARVGTLSRAAIGEASVASLLNRERSAVGAWQVEVRSRKRAALSHISDGIFTAGISEHM